MIRFTEDHYKKTLEQRWNVAMTAAGFVGSEWIDEPERIAQVIRDQKDELMRLRKEVVLLRRRKDS